MADVQIKIASNPYDECVRYYKFDGTDWREITAESNPNSALVGAKYAHGFFPFKAEEIADAIIAEFGNGETINLVFEGSDDEWAELDAICKDGPYANKVTAERGLRVLSNARDILPEIIEVFKEVKPLVDSSVSDYSKVADKVEKFVDVSSDAIPLCVLGNYSAGKSTFINSLIGLEILPNGDEPVTARFFQIRRSKDRDRAMIQFSCDESRYVLRFDPNGLMENKELVGVKLYDEVVAKVGEIKPGMASHMNCALQVLNSFRPDGGEAPISDLIKLEVPFAGSDPWPHDREFVIFDTPGSNSASNEDHVRVLREAMDDLSNGLPIFVAEYSSLDTKDNEKLYEEIRQIPAIDERFAMIVVNKADAADLPKGGFEESDVKRIMGQSIPRNLYGQGIYFVSSILGLGAKIDGDFMSDNYAEKFEDQQRKYIDPESRFYKTLYRYDILPGQISRRTNGESEECKDLLLANSGLFCIENEIRRFAECYSAYNKCKNSVMLLQEIAAIAADEIDKTKEAVKEEKAKREEELDAKKNELIKRLEDQGDASSKEAKAAYDAVIDKAVEGKSWNITYEDMLDRQHAITKVKLADHKHGARTEEAEDARIQIVSNLVERVGDAVRADDDADPMDRAAKFAGGIKDAAQGFVGDTANALEKQADVRSVEKLADKDASGQLFGEVVSSYDKAARDIYETIDEPSRAYWLERAEACRSALYQIATDNTNALSEEKRKEVGEVIINYQALALAKGRTIFNKAEFSEIRLKDQVIFKSDTLFLNRLESRYNHEVANCVAETRNELRLHHEHSFGCWLDELLHQVISNITDYNPVLHDYVEEINQKTTKINELESKLATLDDRKGYVARIIDWKE